MVFYRVYQEPYLERYYSTICSKATLFQVLAYALMTIPPFFLAYTTNGFWQYTSSYREQPNVDFLNRLFVQTSTNDGVGSISTWSSYPNLNALLNGDELATPVIQEVDNDRDGKKDILRLSISFTDLNYTVQAVKAVLFFNVQFSRYSKVTVHSLVYLSQSWALPASRLWVGGALAMNQQVPFPASGRVSVYNTSLLNEMGSQVEDFELRNFLSAYNRRQVTTYLDKPLRVWDGGKSRNFTIDVELTYPALTVVYSPGFWQLIKFAWIQYLSIFVVFWWVLTYMQSFVFQNQVIQTDKRNRMHKHS